MDNSLRYQRNLGPITGEDQIILQNSRVCIIGCGGIGGFLAEYLARLGIGHLTMVDADRIDISNLNRQLLSTESNLGQPKAIAAGNRIPEINSTVSVEVIAEFLTSENAPRILSNHNIVLDALDNIPCRLILQDVCKELGIPLVHGAVDGWFVQVCTVLPGDDSLSRVYPGWQSRDSGASAPIGTLSFIPAMAAAIQASEAVKLLLGKEELLRGRILFGDLLNNRFDILPV